MAPVMVMAARAATRRAEKEKVNMPARTPRRSPTGREVRPAARAGQAGPARARPPGRGLPAWVARLGGQGLPACVARCPGRGPSPARAAPARDQAVATAISRDEPSS